MNGLVKSVGLLGIVSLVIHLSSWPVRAATLQVEANQSTLSIQANSVPLGEVLTAVSEKSGIVIISDEPLTQVVTCSFTGLTLEQGIMQLLENRSYALMLDAKQNAASSPQILWILGNVSASPDARRTVPLKDWFALKVKDSGQLSGQFTAMQSVPQTEEKGITITSLTPDSVLQEIGIRKGDLVSRVNGRPTGTIEEFISVLQSVPHESSTIMMIERRMPDGRLDPIYVHFD